MKTEHLAAAAALAGAAALGTFIALGVMPDATGEVCTVSTARGSCDAAKLLSADPDDCAPGSQVYRRIEQRFDPDAGSEGGLLPPGFDPVPGSTVEVPCVSLRRAAKALTVRKAGAAEEHPVGEWATDAGRWDGRAETAWCPGPGCYCAGRCAPAMPGYIAGDENAQVLRALCLAIPERPECDAGAP